MSLQARPSTHTVSNALVTSRKTTPVSRFSPKFLDTLSTRRACCKDVLCLGLKPNCSSRSSPRTLTSLKILLIRIFSKTFPIVSRRLTGRQDEGSAGSFPDFRMDITRAFFYTGGRCCVLRIALKSDTSRRITRWRRCLRALFGISSGPGVLVTLRSGMAS